MRAFAFLRSALIMIVAGVAVPVGLLTTSQWRFGGASPLHGIGGPGRWSLAALRSSFAQPLTDHVLADVTIRIALLIAWLAVGVFVLTVVAEAAHMVRHGGHHLPDVRGLVWSQRSARAVAAGLLALVPLLSHGSPATAGVGNSALLVRTVPVAVIMPVAHAHGVTPTLAAPVSAAPVVGDYVVRGGDSVFGIATRLAGPDEDAVAAYAERILELNLGREMAGGERFTNPGLIDVGWVLELPALEPAAVGAVPPAGARHVVTSGESLWSIADDEFGDPTRWPELFDANVGRTFDDGRTLDDPALLRPGWDLIVTAGATVDAVEPVAVPDTAPSAALAPMPGEHDAHHADPTQSEALEVVTSDHPIETAEIGAHFESPEPENRWLTPAESESVSAVDESDATDDAPRLLTVRRAVMLAGGVLTLVAVRRRRRLREAWSGARLPEPTRRAGMIERELRGAIAGERMARVDLAARAAALPLIEGGQRLAALLVSSDGTVEIVATGPAELPSYWHGSGDRWTLPASVPLDAIAAEACRVDAPCPALVQLGVDEGDRDVFVDLEAIGALEIGGSAAERDSIVAAIAATLAGSVLAEVTTLVSVAVPADAFLGHRLHAVAADVDAALDLACAAVGALATMPEQVFALRARGTGGERWDPAVVLIGSEPGAVRLRGEVPGLAVVSASPIEGPSSTLRPDGDAWLLRPLGLRLLPIGLVPDDLSAIGDLAVVMPMEAPPAGVDPDRTIYGPDDSVDAERAEQVEEGVPHDWDLMVRLYGPVQVVDRVGRAVAFERSKTTELVAWLATHRDRSTRSDARAALWEQEVRDATFANVVSEARRALARLVPPPEGEEWVGRTLTEALPLHPRVLTDADVLDHALAVARAQSPSQAIETLRGPVASIAGLPFEGTSYLWPDGEGLTSNLILLATSAAAELAARCLAVGDIDGVFEATARGLRVLPGHEELIGLRMRAHARAGDHAAVRQEWSSYERVVNGDQWSDGEPSPKLVDLRKELLHPGV